MSDRCEIVSKPDSLTIRVKPERSLWSMLIAPLLIAFFSKTIVGLGWAAIFLLGLMVWLVWTALWGAFGFEEIELNHDTLSLTSSIFGLRRTRRSPISTVESISYAPSAYRSSSFIGLMLKDKMFPIQIGRGLDPQDGATILVALRSKDFGLTGRIRS